MKRLLVLNLAVLALTVSASANVFTRKPVQHDKNQIQKEEVRIFKDEKRIKHDRKMLKEKQERLYKDEKKAMTK